MLPRVIILVLIAGALLAFAVHRYQWTVVTNGGLFGLTIGSSKSEAFQSVLRLDGISDLQPGNTPNLSVSSDNLSDLPQLMEYDAIVLISDASQTVIYSAEDEILQISHSGVGWRLNGENKSKQALTQKIRTAILSGDVLRAFATVKGYTSSYDRVSVSTGSREFSSEEAGYVWLTEFDTWVFRGPEKWTKITLEFNNGKLTKIIKHRSFGERL